MDYGAIVFGFAAQIDLSTERNCNEIIIALKQVCYKHSRSPKTADGEESDYIELSFGKESLVHLIIGMLSLNPKSQKRSYETIHATLMSIAQMVVGNSKVREPWFLLFFIPTTTYHPS